MRNTISFKKDKTLRLIEFLRRIEKEPVNKVAFQKEFNVKDSTFSKYMKDLEDFGFLIGRSSWKNPNLYLIAGHNNLQNTINLLKKNLSKYSTMKDAEDKKETCEMDLSQFEGKFDYLNLKKIFIALGFDMYERKEFLALIEKIMKPTTTNDKISVIKAYDLFRLEYMKEGFAIG